MNYNRILGGLVSAGLVLAIGLPASAAIAQQVRQQSTQQSSQGDSTSPVTSPPSGFTGGNATNGTDSTLAGGQGIGNSGNSSITAGGGSTPVTPPPPPPPVVTCFAGQTRNLSQSGGTCPTGSAAYNPYGGSATTWTQTATQTETCPAGEYGSPVWTPATPDWQPAVPTDPNGCGWPSGTGVQIGVNNQATFWDSVNGTTGSYPMGRKGGHPGGPSAQFSGTWTWNGQTMFVQVTCTGTEVCSNSLVKTIGGVNWAFSVNGSSLLPADCNQGPNPPPTGNCPLNGSGHVGAQ